MGTVQIGFDVGAATVRWAAVEEGSLVAAPRGRPHFGRPLEALRDSWEEVRGILPSGKRLATAFTGLSARDLARWRPGLLFFHETVAIPWGAWLIAPSTPLLFHMGARQSLFFRLRHGERGPLLKDWSCGTRCGGGSGILLEKQIVRLYSSDGLPADVAEREGFLARSFAQAEAEASSMEVPPYNARCGVIVQSDLIHDQNEGKGRPELLARLYATVARNYLGDVVGSRPLDGAVLATGGLLESPFLRRLLEEASGAPVVHHPLSSSVGAIGAALAAERRENTVLFDFDGLDEARRFFRSRRAFAPPLSESLGRVRLVETSPAAEKEEGPLTLGVDGGSTTTKAVLADLETGDFVAGLYLPTGGRPREALARVLEGLREKSRKREIAVVMTTGSARILYERILLSPALAELAREEGFAVADGAVDEITCHGLGVRFCDDGVDTIFEVGGQDMKFTAFRRSDEGVTDEVIEARMNYSCQAGAGQTLENMARLLDLDVRALQEAALRAGRVPLIDATCGVFMEMEEGRLLAEGFSRDEVAAAIVRATAASYFHRFVGGGAHLQERCSCQGGPSLGRAFLAAMAQVTGREIHAFPHRELFGAWGAALFGRERILALRKEGKAVRSSFRGWSAAEASFEVQKESCSSRFGDLSCGRRDCSLQIFSIGGEEIVSGGFCPRGNSGGAVKPRRDYVRVFHELMERHWPGGEGEVSGGAPTVAIRRSGATLGPLGLWTAFVLRGLGLRPLLGPPSDDETAACGARLAPTDFCLAMKLVFGQAELLAHSSADLLFNGSFVEKVRKGRESLKFCVYTASEGHLVQAALELDRHRSLAPIWRLDDRLQMIRSLASELKRLGLERSFRAIGEAFDRADEALLPFLADIEEEGERFLSGLGDEAGYVGLGRDYVLLDDAASSGMGRLMALGRGLPYLPQIFLRHRWQKVPIDRFLPDEFWLQGSAILQAEALTALHPRLFPVRQMNFACGPDSIRTLLEEEIFRRGEKPLLQLVTDGQTNNAPFATRIEAQERVISLYRRSKTPRLESLFPVREPPRPDRTWIVPYMGDISRLGAALLRHIGQPALCPPTATAASLAWADRVVMAENCLPLRGVVGDVLAFVDEARRRGEEPPDRFLVFLPTTCGPCRMGRYGEVLSIALERFGFGDIPVAGPSTATGYRDFPLFGEFRLRDRISLFLQGAELFLLADVVDALALRYRPYCADREAFEGLRARRTALLEKIIEEKGVRGETVTGWVDETRALYREAARGGEPRLPVALYAGEIYMRFHDGRTQGVVALLEEAGVELLRVPATDWIHYVLAEPKIKGGWPLHLVRIWLKRRERLWRRFCADSVHLPDPFSLVIDLERRGLHHRLILGESGPSLGLFVAFAEGRLPREICGFFHVAPFTCMQEGVAGAQMDAFLRDSKEEVIPLLHGIFGDSPHQGIEAAVAAFAEQCRLRLQSR